MSIFRRSQSEPDLSDAGLNGGKAEPEAAQADNPTPAADGGDAAGDTEVSEVRPGGAEPGQEADIDSTRLATDQQEQRWQEAARSVADHWPRIREDLPALLGRMKEISQRYGDPELWQRSPAGIMREAAVELYGMPARPDAGALTQAVRAAHEQGRKAAAARRRSLAGLAPPQVSRSAPPPLTEEEKILQDMRQARKGRLF